MFPIVRWEFFLTRNINNITEVHKSSWSKTSQNFVILYCNWTAKSKNENRLKTKRPIIYVSFMMNGSSSDVSSYGNDPKISMKTDNNPTWIINIFTIHSRLTLKHYRVSSSVNVNFPYNFINLKSNLLHFAILFLIATQQKLLLRLLFVI